MTDRQFVRKYSFGYYVADFENYTLEVRWNTLCAMWFFIIYEKGEDGDLVINSEDIDLNFIGKGEAQEICVSTAKSYALS